MRRRKVRITATIRKDLALALTNAGRNRSAVLESILENWAEEEKRRKLDEEFASYYKEYADAEETEEGRWLKAVSRHLAGPDID
ncbi:MAG TPA: hypothetical protein VGQ81_09475 [Acidobacteriota bacterium]|jgi:hypothetical protein|nr:hypothetical protein [Acidobacteriota bacterium]